MRPDMQRHDILTGTHMRTNVIQVRIVEREPPNAFALKGDIQHPKQATLSLQTKSLRPRRSQAGSSC